MKNEAKTTKELHIGRQFSYDLVKSYHAKFIDKNTGRFNKIYTETRNCPVCASDNSTYIFDASGGSYVKCDNCSMVYINPIFTRYSLNLYYQQLNTGQAQITENESDFYREIYGMGLGLINKFVAIGKILDIGCSGGFFLDIAKHSGWSTAGIELNREEAEICRKRGHCLFTEEIEDCNIDNKFDAITLWDVFEHIPDSKAYLGILKKYLVDNGIIFLQIPNSDALAAKIMREKCKMFDGVEHVNLYNPTTLRLVAQDCGFMIVYMRTVISEIGVINNYLNYDDPYFGNSNYGSSIAGIINEGTLHEKLLGYKIQAVLRNIAK